MCQDERSAVISARAEADRLADVEQDRQSREWEDDLWEQSQLDDLEEVT